jgi:hypothetical protein
MTPVESAAVCRFLATEKVKRHTEYEVLCRDRDTLVRQHHNNPISVRPDRIETASRLVDEARVVDRYLGSILAGFPVVTS